MVALLAKPLPGRDGGAEAAAKQSPVGILQPHGRRGVAGAVGMTPL
jgi:hypothetical protein